MRTRRVSELNSRIAPAGDPADADGTLPRRGRPRALVILRLLRVHHWTKNLLVFVPLLLAHRFTDAGRSRAAFLVFLSFSFAASAGYVVNDLADLSHDRSHHSRRDRPLVAAEITPLQATLLVLPLVLASFALALRLPRGTAAIVGLYFLLSCLYTFVIKRLVIADVLLLAGFYSLRLLAGGMATSIVVSHWLLAFSSFLFFSLALAKRTSDLMRAAERDEEAAVGVALLLSA